MYPPGDPCLLYVGFGDDTPRETATLFQMLLHQPYFRVGAIPDVAGVETQGAVKNIIALAAGFVDGALYN